MEEYVNIAKNRVAELLAGTLRTRPMNKPVYQPPFNKDIENDIY